MKYSTAPFHTLVDSNPKVSLKKGEQYPFISMGAISPGKRFAVPDETRLAGGGAKFQDGDILFARITPCLQNGKIAQARINSDCIGFGSTEFFIFRAKKNVYDQSFLFYVCQDKDIRAVAEKSMVGASGRQRANISSIEEFEIPFPPLPIQKRIAGILSAYDDLIAMNERRIAILEEMARRVFEEWFVKFRFPGSDISVTENDPPNGWKKVPATVAFDIRYGKTLAKTKLILEGLYPVYGAGGVIGRYNEKNIEEPTTLITSRGAGSGHVWRANEEAYVTNNSFTVKSNKLSEGWHYGMIFLTLQNAAISNAVSGAAQPQLTHDGLSSVLVTLPDRQLSLQFSKLIEPVFALVARLTKNTANLRATRDLLLPRLISGEIDVSQMPDAADTLLAAE